METDRQSSEESLKSIEDNYRRDSFDDRVCDDLCEVILKYLSLKDKLKLEFVSKQFQRTVFNSQSKQYLILSPKSDKHLEKLKQLSEKYPKLNRIYFGGEVISNPLIEVIIKNCNNLTHIQFRNYTQIGTEVLEKFFNNFGHKLISITNSHQNIGSQLRNAPNIEELTVNTFDSQLSQIEFNKLKRFCVSQLKAVDLNSFELFIENNTKTLKYLDIRCTRFNDEESVKSLLKIISKTINLVHLSIDIWNYMLIDDSLIDYWTEIPINCKQLKSLKFRLNYKEILRFKEELFSLFKRLKRLELFFTYHFQSFQLFKGLKKVYGLTHLTLYVCSDSFDDTLLTDIDINLPKLKSLKIRSPLIASEWTAQILTRLTNLEKVQLNIVNKEIGPEIERQLIQNCKKFKNFKII